MDGSKEPVSSFKKLEDCYNKTEHTCRQGLGEADEEDVQKIHHDKSCKII
jgi:hypothetical protein